MGCTSPQSLRFPSALEIALGQSRGPRGAKSPPSGNLLGLGGCISQYIPPLGSVRIQYQLVQKYGKYLIFILPIIAKIFKPAPIDILLRSRCFAVQVFQLPFEQYKTKQRTHPHDLSQLESLRYNTHIRV